MSLPDLPPRQRPASRDTGVSSRETHALGAIRSMIRDQGPDAEGWARPASRDSLLLACGLAKTSFQAVTGQLQAKGLLEVDTTVRGRGVAARYRLTQEGHAHLAAGRNGPQRSATGHSGPQGSSYLEPEKEEAAAKTAWNGPEQQAGSGHKPGRKSETTTEEAENPTGRALDRLTEALALQVAETARLTRLVGDLLEGAVQVPGARENRTETPRERDSCSPEGLGGTKRAHGPETPAERTLVDRLMEQAARPDVAAELRPCALPLLRSGHSEGVVLATLVRVADRIEAGKADHPPGLALTIASAMTDEEARGLLASAKRSQEAERTERASEERRIKAPLDAAARLRAERQADLERIVQERATGSAGPSLIDQRATQALERLRSLADSKALPPAERPGGLRSGAA